MESETSKKALGESLDNMVAELGKGSKSKGGKDKTPKEKTAKEKSAREEEAKNLQKTIKMFLSK